MGLFPSKNGIYIGYTCVDRDKYTLKTCFDFFSSNYWGFSTGTKGEKLNFYSSNIP
jgi:hypothetical protein